MPKNPTDPCDDCGDPPDHEVEQSRSPVPLAAHLENVRRHHRSLEAAGKQLVDGERWSDYGDPRLAWDRIARLWSVVLGTHVTARQAVLCMIGMKVVRESISGKADNLDDIEGYTDILRRLER
ncbi:MAG: hypothetical protein GTO14_24065 [Anaerolineales bacterium]|nr:hypothetical protein [Anaerolineales bacterium]